MHAEDWRESENESGTLCDTVTVPKLDCRLLEAEGEEGKGMSVEYGFVRVWEDVENVGN